MGELFAHFEGWDVQAIRKEAREESIMKIVRVMSKLNVSKDVVKEQLMEEYAMSEDELKKKSRSIGRCRKKSSNILEENPDIKYEIAKARVILCVGIFLLDTEEEER